MPPKKRARVASVEVDASHAPAVKRLADSLGTDLTPEAIANADYGLRNAAFGALRNKIGGDASLWQEFQALESKAEKHAWLADYILDPSMAKRTFAVNKTTRTTRNLQDEKVIWLTEAFNGLAIDARGEKCRCCFDCCGWYIIGNCGGSDVLCDPCREMRVHVIKCNTQSLSPEVMLNLRADSVERE